MPTVAEQWIEEGFQKGMQQGLLKKSRQAVIALLELRFACVPQMMRGGAA